jgi:hypothetical protein
MEDQISGKVILMSTKLNGVFKRSIIRKKYKIQLKSHWKVKSKQILV